jgi:hypothetical protein
MRAPQCILACAASRWHAIRKASERQKKKGEIKGKLGRGLLKTLKE